MERELLLLGLLRNHEMHGYRLYEIIDRHLGTSVHLKKPTAYRLLNRMSADGWITHREERDGNRPPRRVYTITPEGEQAFQQLLRDSLADYKPTEFHSDVSLAFLDLLPKEESLALLLRRRSTIDSLLQTMLTVDRHHGSFQLVIEHRRHHLSTELEWLDGVIDQVKTPRNGT